MVSSITASIENGTRRRNDLEYIPGYKILERANTPLSWPVTITDPATGKRVTKDLRPDALFGIEYKTEQGSRYRFYVVEADRGTEPLTSSTINRKSALRNILQYEAYILGGEYKKHLKLTSPMLVLNVLISEQRMQHHLESLSDCGAMRNVMLFSCVDEILAQRRSVKDMDEVNSRPWLRAGLSPVTICKR